MLTAAAVPPRRDSLVELSLAECIGAPGAMTRIAADGRFLASLSSLTALDLSCNLRDAILANAEEEGKYGGGAPGLRAALFNTLEAMPPTLTTLTLPESIGDFAYEDDSDGYGEELGATLGRMKGEDICTMSCQCTYAIATATK